MLVFHVKRVPLLGHQAFVVGRAIGDDEFRAVGPVGGELGRQLAELAVQDAEIVRLAELPGQLTAGEIPAEIAAPGIEPVLRLGGEGEVEEPVGSPVMPGHQRAGVFQVIAHRSDHLHAIRVFRDDIDRGRERVGLLEERRRADDNLDPFHVVEVDRTVQESVFVRAIELLAVDQQGHLVVVVGRQSPHRGDVFQIPVENREPRNRLQQVPETAVSALLDDIPRIDIHAARRVINPLGHPRQGALGRDLHGHQLLKTQLFEPHGGIRGGGIRPRLRDRGRWLPCPARRAGQKNQQTQDSQPRARRCAAPLTG